MAARAALSLMLLPAARGVRAHARCGRGERACGVRSGLARRTPPVLYACMRVPRCRGGAWGGRRCGTH